jgi:hypothetical protein
MLFLLDYPKESMGFTFIRQGIYEEKAAKVHVSIMMWGNIPMEELLLINQKEQHQKIDIQEI